MKIYNGNNCPNCGEIPAQLGVPEFFDPKIVLVSTTCSHCGVDYTEQYELQHASVVGHGDDLIRNGDKPYLLRSSGEELLPIARDMLEKLHYLESQNRMDSVSYRNSKVSSNICGYLQEIEERLEILAKKVEEEVANA